MGQRSRVPMTDRAVRRRVALGSCGVALGLFAAGSAGATCSCTCVDGHTQPLCTSSFDRPAVCLSSPCPIAPHSLPPSMSQRPPPIGASTCRLAQATNAKVTRGAAFVADVARGRAATPFEVRKPSSGTGVPTGYPAAAPHPRRIAPQKGQGHSSGGVPPPPGTRIGGGSTGRDNMEISKKGAGGREGERWARQRRSGPSIFGGENRRGLLFIARSQLPT